MPENEERPGPPPWWTSIAPILSWIVGLGVIIWEERRDGSIEGYAVALALMGFGSVLAGLDRLRK